jgi:phosphatidylserine decarboxylase
MTAKTPPSVADARAANQTAHFAASTAPVGETESLSSGNRLFIALQHVIPQHGISRLVHAATRSRAPWFKNLLVSTFMRGFRPDLSDAIETDPLAYESFNAFFTRALQPGARALPADPDQLACPVDGTVSQAGRIEEDGILQAKGRQYSLAALLADRRDWVARFRGGHFATIYLAPYNYHRIHMATAGTLRETWYVPGRLFSVNRATVASVGSLFARNERVICCFEQEDLSHALVMVGALNVGSIETPWHGEITPGRPRSLCRVPPRPGAPSVVVARGDELGRFNMGSTVILLFPPGRIEWQADFQPGRVVRMGEPIGRLLRQRG